jgi:hypothetical protein
MLFKQQAITCIFLTLFLKNANCFLNWNSGDLLEQLDSVPHHAENFFVKSYVVHGTNDYEYGSEYGPVEKRIKVVPLPKYGDSLAKLEEYFKNSENEYMNSIIKPISNHLTSKVIEVHKKLQEQDPVKIIQNQIQQQFEQQQHQHEKNIELQIEHELRKQLKQKQQQKEQQQHHKHQEDQENQWDEQRKHHHIQNHDLQQLLQEQENQNHHHQQQQQQQIQEEQRYYWFKNNNGKYDHLNNTELFIEFDKEETKEKVQDLLKYIANITTVPYEAIQDLSIDKNMIVFRVNQKSDFDSDLFINKILKHQLLIELEKNMTILDADLAQNNMRIKFVKEVDSAISTDNLLLILTIIFVPIILAIGLALGICLIRKRSRMSDDEETLVKDNESTNKKKRFGTNWMPPLDFLKRSKLYGNNQQQNNELCRQQMESRGNNTPMNSTYATTTPRTDSSSKSLITSNTISTPISLKKDDKNGSDSSW